MSKEATIKSYEILMQIEIGLREYFIELIREFGIKEWFIDFLGKLQRESINVVKQRFQVSLSNDEVPQIADLYQVKLHRAIHGIKILGSNTILYHPFYYLNWTDLEALLRMRNNAAMIDARIGVLNRNLLVEHLSRVSPIRNDIAHSRYVSHSDYKLVQSLLEFLQNTIANFLLLSNSPTKERFTAVSELGSSLKKLTDDSEMTMNHVHALVVGIDSLLESFWLNSLVPELCSEVRSIGGKIKQLENHLNSMGGVLMISSWRKENFSLLERLIDVLENEQIRY